MIVERLKYQDRKLYADCINSSNIQFDIEIPENLFIGYIMNNADFNPGVNTVVYNETGEGHGVEKQGFINDMPHQQVSVSGLLDEYFTEMNYETKIVMENLACEFITNELVR